MTLLEDSPGVRLLLLACGLVVCRKPHNVHRFSRVARDGMMAQLAKQERSGPRRLQPRVSRGYR